MIEAANGKSLPAVDVYAMALKFLKDKALEQISKQDISHISNKRIQWIITVPAIWTYVAKDVMRNAAKKVKTYRYVRSSTSYIASKLYNIIISYIQKM